MAVTFDELGRRLKEERERLGKALDQLRASAPAVVRRGVASRRGIWDRRLERGPKPAQVS